MSQDRFEALVGEIAAGIAGKPLDSALAGYLNRCWPREGAMFAELRELCAEGERTGWLMSREAGGIRLGGR